MTMKKAGLGGGAAKEGAGSSGGGGGGGWDAPANVSTAAAT